MGFFSKILEKLGMSHTETPSAAAGAGSNASPASSPSASDIPAAPAPISVVDVVAQLEQRAATNPQGLNWQASIVDLLKLLDMDSSLAARKELAAELACPQDLMQDSAGMNTWLHKQVLKRIAANGGNVPADLLN